MALAEEEEEGGSRVSTTTTDFDGGGDRTKRVFHTQKKPLTTEASTTADPEQAQATTNVYEDNTEIVSWDGRILLPVGTSPPPSHHRVSTTTTTILNNNCDTKTLLQRARNSEQQEGPMAATKTLPPQQRDVSFNNYNTTNNGNMTTPQSAAAASFDYTEHTYHSSIDDDEDEDETVQEFEEELGDGDDHHHGVLGEKTEEESSADAASSSEGCWNSDDGILYQHNSDIETSRRPVRRQMSGGMSSLSAHTLSTAFSLDDLGSADTVSSLEDEVDDVDDDHGEVLPSTDPVITFDGVGLLNMGRSSPKLWRSSPSQLSPKRLNFPAAAVVAQADTVNDLCSLDSTDQKLRRVQEKVVSHQLKRAFGSRPRNLRRRQRRSRRPCDEETKEDSNCQSEGSIDEEEIQEIVAAEEIDEEVVVEDTESGVRRLVSRMHRSIVITTPLRKLKTDHPSLESRRRWNNSNSNNESDKEEDSDQEFFPSGRTYSMDELDGTADDGEDFLNDVDAARAYLLSMAVRPQHGLLPGNSPEGQHHERTNSHDGSAAAVFYSSDDYTEVLVSSSDGSLIYEEEDVLGEVGSPLLPNSS